MFVHIPPQRGAIEVLSAVLPFLRIADTAEYDFLLKAG
jgi:hypothetical protein